MVTTDEIAEMPLFAALSAADRERLSRTSADISLAAGEYAVHEGDERALFVVLEGKIEVVKRRRRDRARPRRASPRRDLRRGADHARHAVPERLPRGRRPRASCASRHRTTTRSPLQRPRSRSNVGALARERIGGLQGVAAEPPQPRALVVGHRWDAACSELRRFLDRNQITFEWLTPDAADAAERWDGALPPTATCPRSASRTGRRWYGHGCARSPSSSASRPSASAERVRHGHHRRRAGRPRRRRVRGFRGPAHDRDRAGGAGRAGGDVVADRELPRLSVRRLGRRARPAARCSRRGGSARRSS